MSTQDERKKVYQDWADTVVKIWKAQIQTGGPNQAFHSGNLLNSLNNFVNTQADGSADRIDFFFEYYGKFVDMGVGGNISLANRGAMTALDAKRKPKKWFTDTFFYQVHRLREIMAKELADLSSVYIVRNLDDNAEKWKKEKV